MFGNSSVIGMQPKVTISTEPFDIQGLGVVRMVHFRLRASATTARLLKQLSAALVDARITTSGILQSLFWAERMCGAPCAHVGRMAFIAVALIVSPKDALAAFAAGTNR